MKKFGRYPVFLIIMLAVALTGAGQSYGKLVPGQAAPAFSARDLKDKPYDLSQMQSLPLVILYFFDIDSKSSREGLLSLRQMAGQYPHGDLAVWAVTLSPKEKVAAFISGNNLTFPVLLDTSGVSDLYDAQTILPTVCILGPGLKVLDHLQGGGKTSELMLVKLAERELQRKQTQVAIALSEQVAKKDPQNIRAKAIKGHAALKEGKVDEAGQVFEELARKAGQGEVLGKEGLAAVHMKKGEPDKALKLAEEVERKAPDRSYPNVIKGDVLYARNKVAEARSEYRKATTKKQAEPYLKPVGYNQLGRLYAKNGDNEAARKLYDEAVAIDPYYIEGTTNKGLTYQKEGKWDKALETYHQALGVEKTDVYATALARQAQEMANLQKDRQKSERIDRLVKELAERYRSQQKSASKDQDEWTSRPMILAFVDFQEKGALTERDGISTVLTLQLTDYLNQSKRVQVVERALMDKLLEELNLGSSELADPQTALRLGKVLAAKLIGTGSLLNLPNGSSMTMRLIDTETTSIPMIMNRDLGPQTEFEKDLYQINREILKTVISKYPLRGFVVKPIGDRVLLNLGANQGVVMGTKFEVLDEAQTVEYKGKKLQGASRAVGQIEVVDVQPDLSYARIVSKERTLKTDDKVQEKLETVAMGEGNVSR
ncbi:MAG: tetratricopeptide repeat protein [Syntrophobacteraceae bacterium]